jgi:hypothetical protein
MAGLALLVRVTGDQAARMSYIQYFDKVVLVYRVILHGWTYSKLVKPSSIKSLAALEVLWRAIESGQCTFVQASDDEIGALQQDLEVTASPRVRKERSDKGKKRNLTASALPSAESFEGAEGSNSAA